MKKIKRIIVIILLVALILVVGYLNFSGSRLFSKCDFEDYRNTEYYAIEQNIFLSIDNEMTTIYGVDEVENELSFLRQKNGIFTFSDGINSYEFIITSEGSLYDVQTDTILYRST